MIQSIKLMAAILVGCLYAVGCQYNDWGQKLKEVESTLMATSTRTHQNSPEEDTLIRISKTLTKFANRPHGHFFFPKSGGSGDNQRNACAYYPRYNAIFTGFGKYNTYLTSIDLDDAPGPEPCVQQCYVKKKVNDKINGMLFSMKTGSCKCIILGQGYVDSVDSMYYLFVKKFIL